MIHQYVIQSGFAVGSPGGHAHARHDALLGKGSRGMVTLAPDRGRAMVGLRFALVADVGDQERGFRVLKHPKPLTTTHLHTQEASWLSAIVANSNARTAAKRVRSKK